MGTPSSISNSIASPLFASPKPIAKELSFTEGPVWHPSGRLFFSDIPQETIYCWAPVDPEAGDGVLTTAFSGSSCNGLVSLSNTELIVCGHSARSVFTVDLVTGRRGRTLASTFGGARLNSPNDAILVPDTNLLIFTDPAYGIRPAEQVLPHRGLYILAVDDPDTLWLLDDRLQTPNGLCLNPAQDALFVADSEANRILRYPFGMRTRSPADRRSGGTQIAWVGEPELFANVAIPDGLLCDQDGFVYAASHVSDGGVHIFRPDGAHTAHIHTPEAASNCCLGGIDGRSLFITARETVYCALRV